MLVTTRACSKCKEDRPVAMFQHFKGRPSGQCRICKTEAEKARRAAQGIPVKNLSRIENCTKLCVVCEEMKPLDQLSPSERGLSGVQSACRPCFRLRYGRSREDAGRPPQHTANAIRNAGSQCTAFTSSSARPSRKQRQTERSPTSS